MLNVKGVFQNGVARPAEPVKGRDGQPVIITFLDEYISDSIPSGEDTAWKAFAELIEECAVETGVADLAHQHDHYLYGKPKRE